MYCYFAIYNTIYFRAGVDRKPLGQWFTTEPAESVIKVRTDLAVREQWVNPKTGVLEGTSVVNMNYTIKIPKGTIVYEGPVGFQGGPHLGGMNIQQTFIEEPWNIPGIEERGSKPLR